MKGIALALAMMVLLPIQAFAICPDWLGYAVLKSAWPTPEYTRCEIYSESTAGKGRTISLKAHGNSRISMLSDKEVWVEANVEIENSSLKNVSFGKYKAAFPPKLSWGILSDAVKDHPR